MRAAVLLVFVAACGASAGEIRAAREARYDVEPDVVFQAMMDVAQSQYGVQEYDENAAALATEERWYSAEGSHLGRGTEDHPVEMTKGMVMLQFVLRVSGDAHAWTVEIEPVANRFVDWSMQMQGVNENDMPYWVKDRIDSLYVAIHGKLKEHAVVATPAP